jgi:hypothetical protein
LFVDHPERLYDKRNAVAFCYFVERGPIKINNP